MNIHSHITLFCGRFVHIHTFFHRKIMCSCQLVICLCDIRRANYKRRLHRSHIAPPKPILAEFALILVKIYPWSIRATTPVLSRVVAVIVYRHILLGENLHSLIRTRIHEKIQLDFFARRAIICIIYCWGKCKKL